MRTIYIDDGHGMNTAGKRTPIITRVLTFLYNMLFKNGRDGSNQIKENEFNSAVQDKLKVLAERKGYRVVLIAPEVNDVALSTRSKRANDDYNLNVHNRDKAILVSIHFNAFDGKFNTNSGGIETYHYTGSTSGAVAARIIHKELIKGTKLIDRGVKSANFHILRETFMPAVLVECGFMDVEQEAMLMLDHDYQDETAREILAGIDNYFDEVDPIADNPAGTYIIGPATATVEQAEAWAISRKASDTFIKLAKVYWQLGTYFGADPAIAYAQSAKETGFGRFGGVIDETYHNPCGMKNSDGGGNYDPTAHKKFISWQEGIEAHIDHLLLYAGAVGYPKPNTPDPRHFPYLIGKAKTVEELSGKWAPSLTYGQSIVNDYLNPMRAIKIDTPIIEPKPDYTYLIEENTKLKAENKEFRVIIDIQSEKLDTIRQYLEQLLKTIKL